MSDLLSTLSTGLGLAKQLHEISKKYDDATVKMLVADLMSQLADAKVEAASLKEENANLRAQLAQAERQSSAASEAEFRDGYYWRKVRVQGKPDGPFCTNCFDAEGKLVLLLKQNPPFDDFGTYMCPQCKQFFGGNRL